MPGLTSGLYIGLSGLSSHQSALSVVGHNIANVNTPGYSRQRADFSTTDSQLFGGLLFGSGTTLQTINGARDRFLDLQLIREQSRQAGSEGRFAGIQAVSPTLGDTGPTGLNDMVQKFFQGFQDLSTRPEDLSVRQSLVGKAQSLISAMQNRYRQLDDQRRSANDAIATGVAEINSLSAEIATLNQQVAAEVPPAVNNDARDQRKQLVDKLSTLVGLQIFEDAKGQQQITLDSGKAILVSGGTSFQLTVTTDPAYQNNYRVDSIMGGTTVDVTAAVSNGDLGARLDLRDNVLPGFQRQLDQLAAGIAGQVNLLHRTGFDRSGTVTGLDFFQGGVANGVDGLPTTVSAASNYQGMVNALSVNSAISASPALIASGGVAGASGDNTIARAIANLQTAGNTVDTDGDAVGDSGPFSQVIGILIAQVGTQSETYKNSAETQATLVTSLKNQRDRVSGVDLDEEAAALINLQRGYQASARFISVISELSEQLIAQFGR